MMKKRNIEFGKLTKPKIENSQREIKLKVHAEMIHFIREGVPMIKMILRVVPQN